MNDRNGSNADAGKETEAKEMDSQTDSVDVNQFYGTVKDMVEKYSHCTLCGANLHFMHVTDFQRNLTQETARCPECGVKNRQVLHKLQ